MENKEKSLQEIADELKDFPGHVKGEAFKTRVAFIRKKEGDEGVKRLEEKMKELGVPVDLEGVKSTEWVNEGVNSLCVPVAKEIFNWTEEDVFDLGRFAFKTSFLTKTILRYLVSLKTAINAIPKYWRNYYDFGEMEAVDYSEEGKYGIVRKKGYKTHPLLCIQHKGYLTAGARLILGGKKVHVEETKCMHKGDDYHEYRITWE